MTEHTPTPWFAEDWTDDSGSKLVTVSAHEPEVLAAGQSSIWPDGIRKIRIADTEDSPNPIEDAAFIVKAVNNHDALVKALKAACGYLMNAKIDLSTQLHQGGGNPNDRGRHQARSGRPRCCGKTVRASGTQSLCSVTAA